MIRESGLTIIELELELERGLLPKWVKYNPFVTFLTMRRYQYRQGHDIPRYIVEVQNTVKRYKYREYRRVGYSLDRML